MQIYFLYALILGLVASAVVILGFLLNRKTWVLFTILITTFFASPITSFTRAEAGAVLASDFVGLILCICMVAGVRREWFAGERARWWGSYRFLLIVFVLSLALVSPITSMGLAETRYASRVRTAGFLPLPILMAGFRLLKIIGLWATISFACRLDYDEAEFKVVRWTCILGAACLATAEIFTKFGVMDLHLEVPWRGVWQGARVLGMPKASGGRLMVLGLAMVALRIERFWNPVNLAMLALIIAGLIFSGSKASLTAMCISIVALGLLGRGRGVLMLSLAATASAIGLVIVEQHAPDVSKMLSSAEATSAMAGRTAIWKWNAQWLVHHPLAWITGVGGFNYAYALAGQGAISEHAHNDYLNCAIELGIVGLIAMLAYIRHLLGTFWQGVRTLSGRYRWESLCLLAVLTGYLFASIFEQTFYPSISGLPMVRGIAIVLGAYAIRTGRAVNEAALEMPYEEEDLPEPELAGGQSY